MGLQPSPSQIQPCSSLLPLQEREHPISPSLLWGQTADLGWGVWQQVQTPDKRGSHQNTCRTHLTPQGPQVSSPRSDPGFKASQGTERERVRQTNIHKERETDRKTEKQGERKKQRHTYRAETEIPRERQRDRDRERNQECSWGGSSRTGGRRVEALQPPQMTVQTC